MTPSQKLAAAAAATALAALSGCAALQRAAGALQPPTLNYESWSPEALDLEGVTIALHYRLENPNSFGLSLSRLDYRLEVDGTQVAAGELPAGVEIKAQGASPLVLPVRLRWSDVPHFAQVLATQRDVGYRVTGSAGVGSPLGTVELPFDHAGRVAVPQPPRFSVEGIDLEELSFSGLAFAVRLRIENPNAFPLPVGALVYGLRLGEHEIFKDGSHPLAAVPPGGEAVVSVPVRISVVGARKSIGAIMHGAEVRLRGTAGFGGIEVPVDAGGRVKP
jgi:LEA14-like dessication related protein